MGVGVPVCVVEVCFEACLGVEGVLEVAVELLVPALELDDALLHAVDEGRLRCLGLFDEVRIDRDALAEVHGGYAVGRATGPGALGWARARARIAGSGGGWRRMMGQTLRGEVVEVGGWEAGCGCGGVGGGARVLETVEELVFLLLEGEDLLLELGHALIAAEPVLLGGETVALATAVLCGLLAGVVEDVERGVGGGRVACRGGHGAG